MLSAISKIKRLKNDNLDNYLNKEQELSLKLEKDINSFLRKQIKLENDLKEFNELYVFRNVINENINNNNLRYFEEKGMGVILLNYKYSFKDFYNNKVDKGTFIKVLNNAISDYIKDGVKVLSKEVKDVEKKLSNILDTFSKFIENKLKIVEKIKEKDLTEVEWDKIVDTKEAIASSDEVSKFYKSFTNLDFNKLTKILKEAVDENSFKYENLDNFIKILYSIGYSIDEENDKLIKNTEKYTNKTLGELGYNDTAIKKLIPLTEEVLKFCEKLNNDSLGKKIVEVLEKEIEDLSSKEDIKAIEFKNKEKALIEASSKMMKVLTILISEIKDYLTMTTTVIGKIK